MAKKDATMFFVGGCSGSHSPEFSRDTFGNLTTALGIVSGNRGMFIDNGSGVGKVSSYLLKKGIEDAYGFQTHFHLDHRLGIHGNKILFAKDVLRGFYAPKLSRRSFKRLFESDFGKETWPIAPTGVSIVEFEPGRNLATPFGVKTLLLNHPGEYMKGGSIAYRIETKAGDVVVATDSEPSGEHAQALAKFISGCVLFYVDVQYRNAEYDGSLGVCGTRAESRVGWGHGTPDMLFRVLASCQKVPKRIVVGHHDPLRTTKDLFIFEEEVKTQLIAFPSVVQFACEGDEIAV